MCGIAGVFYFNQGEKLDSRDRDKAQLLLESISHRGPDDSNVWLDDFSSSILVHARLAIRDLTISGRQPMLTSCGNFAITYNGELYGDEGLALISSKSRARLRGTSDTEILLEALAQNNTESVLRSLNGMFALAFVDRNNKTLTLARDRFGEKPLYYHFNAHRVIFASELAALSNFGDFSKELDRAACAAFMRHNYFPGDRTAIKGVYKLPPGSYLEFSRDGTNQLHKYFVAQEDFGKDSFKDKQASLEDLETVLKQSISERLISDVPIGCLLSGGIDSSLVAVMMQELNRGPIDTFAIGFENKEFNEAPFARQVAERLGTNHHELYVTERDALDIVPELSSIYSEPFADSSQIPTVLVSRFARAAVPVVLTGDGGDEMFAGYTRYAKLLDLESPKLSRVRKIVSVGGMQRLSKIMLETLPESFFERIFGIQNARSKSERYFQSFISNKSIDIYRAMVSHWPNPTEIINTSSEYVHSAWSKDFSKGIKSRLDLMRLIDICTYLPDDILVKVDRASMSVGLETRAPFLDPRVFSIASRLPTSSLMKNGELKAPLKDLAYRLIGRDIMDRKKMGFGVPLSAWLRGPLRDWAEDLMRQENRGDLFNERLLRTYWERHLSGEDWGYWIWNYLMLKDWLSRQSRISV